MKPSIVHHCTRQEKVAERTAEPPAASCNCKRVVSYKQADEMVKNGTALWVVVARERGVEAVVCPLCAAQKDVKNCARCEGTGKIEQPAVWDKYNGDIVLISHRNKSNRVSTPHAPTISAKHILRAYVKSETRELVQRAQNAKGDWRDEGFAEVEQVSPQQAKAARDRIDEYGLLTLEARIFPGPDRCTHDAKFKCTRCEVGLPTGVRFAAIKPEPEDNPKTSTGREYDFGRAI